MLSSRNRYVLIFVFAWTFAIFFRKIALNLGAHPISFLVHSGIVSVIILTTYILLKRRKEFPKLKNKKIYWLIISMGIAVGTAWIFDTWGLKLTSSINYSFLLKSGFVFSIIFGYVFFKEPLTRLKIILSISLLYGAYLMTASGEGIVPSTGDLLVIGAALFYSTSSVFQKKLTKHLSGDIIGWIRTSFAVGIIILFMLLINPEEINGSIIAPLYILLTGILLSFTTVYLNKSLAVVSLSYLTMMTMTVPVLNGILGYVFLHETLTTVQIIGGIIILASGYLVYKFKVV